jgi:hypothetical protein
LRKQKLYYGKFVIFHWRRVVMIRKTFVLDPSTCEEFMSVNLEIPYT